MTRVVVDTNALLLPFLDGTDLRSELENALGAVDLVVPSSVRTELSALQAGEGRTARAARAAQRLVADATQAATELPGDDGVLDVARRLGATVLTNDKRLQAECRRSGLRVVASRGHGRLWAPFG